MDISYAVIFVAIAAGGFYFLANPHRVRSVIMLRLAFVNLGLSLSVAALAILFRSSTDRDLMSTVIIASAFANLFLGAATICLVFVAFPATNSPRESYVRRHNPIAKPVDFDAPVETDA